MSMIFKNNGLLELPKLKVKYTKSNETIEQFITEEGKQWWLDFDAKWDDIEIIEFIDVSYTQDQLDRFEEIKGINTNEEALNEYVMNGTLDDKLGELKLKKENEYLRQRLADLTEVVLMGGI